MDRTTALKILDAVLFVSDSPVPVEHLHSVLEEFSREEVRALIDELNTQYQSHGLHIVEIAEGFQLRTRPEYADWVKKFHKINRSTKLSQAALETLSIIAYRQPITRQEVEDIRGVDCSGVLKNLLDKNLVKSLGRRKVPGKPVTFGTTKKFLEYFGLVKLTDLPTLKDFPGDEAAVMQETLDFSELPEPSAEDYEEGDGEEGDLEYARGERFDDEPEEAEGPAGNVEDPAEEDEDGISGNGTAQASTAAISGKGTHAEEDEDPAPEDTR